jgi:tetratricopeptide (TPR) repeat protein
MTPTISPADWEWLKSRIDLLGSLEQQDREPFLNEVRAQRPDLAKFLDLLLDAPTRTLIAEPAGVAADPRKHRTFSPGDLIGGRYRVRSAVGAGGMGEVYEVEDTHMPERGALALKTVRSDLLGNAEIAARFEREVRHALELAHPNVCRMYDVNRHTPAGGSPADDLLFVTMEFLSGGTLSRWMKSADGRPRAAPEAEAYPLIRQMATGLTAIHEQRIVHRDFKPLNVMLVAGAGGPRAVITDLGLARAIRDRAWPEKEGDHTLTRTGHSPGTPAYMAPEVKAGAPAGYPADVFSFGVTVFEMLTGGRTELTEAGKKLKAAGVSARLTAVIVKCLERDPAKRYAGAGEVAAALENKLALPRPQIRAAALILSGVAAAWGGYYWWSNRAPEIPARAAEWYRDGVSDMQSGSYYAAAKKFQEATRLAPDFTMAHVVLAEAWYSLDGHNPANAEMLKAAGRLTPREEAYREGIRLTLSGQAARAVDSFRTAASRINDARDARLELALALDRAGRGAEARKIFAELTEVYPYASLRLAIVDARGGRWNLANPEFDKAIDSFRRTTNAEGETEALYQRGSLNLQALNLDTATQLLNEVLDRVRLTHNAFQEVRARIGLSAAEMEAGHTENAIALARTAMKSASDQGVEVLYSLANRSLATAYKAAGDFDKAEPLLREAVRLAHEDSNDRLEAGAVTLLSDLHNAMGRLSDAASEAETALAYYDRQNNPQLVVQAARAAANAYRDLGQFDKAAALANHALKSAASDGLTGASQETAGNVELARERYAGAVDHLRLALAANTRAKAAIGVLNESIFLGEALGAMGEFSEAGRMLDAAEKMAGKDRDTLNRIRLERGELEVYRGRPREAASLIAAIPRDDSDPEQTARIELILDAAQSGQPAGRAESLLKADKDGVSFALRHRVRFAAARDFLAARDTGAAARALGSPADYGDLAELNWRALLLAAQLTSGAAANDPRTQALTAMRGRADELGYALSGKPASKRFDLRDELRELLMVSSEK